MNNSVPFYTIALEPSGPLANQLISLEQALETCRELEAAGHTIRWIKHGSEIWEGQKLRDAIDEI